MKGALKEVQPKLNRRKRYVFDLEEFEVDLVEHSDKPDKPVCITLRSTNGESVEIFASPSVVDRFGKLATSQAARALTLPRP